MDRITDINYYDSVVERFWKYVDVRSIDECWEWKGSLTVRGGYGQLMLFIDNKRILKKAHRLSYEINIGEIPNKLMICHTCNNPKCCNPKHLYAGTPSDNWRDAIESGSAYKLPILVGEDSPSSKLTEDDIRCIRSSSENGVVLGKKYGVSRVTISHIRRRKTWKHI